MKTKMVVNIVLLILYGMASATDEKKRLLLNDADVILGRLTQLETAMALQTETNARQSQTILSLQAAVQSYQNTGSTFTRWGRKQCPENTSELIYSGFAGGGHFYEKGSAAEYVCLPPDPNFDKTTNANENDGHMYGAEYELHFFGINSANEDVPCAICRSIKSTTTIMIPAKNVCYDGWTLQYHGYLASGHWDHPAASSYVCMDSNIEWLNAGAADMNGKLFYNVAARCGSLQCPPYINNYPLTCVVCSK